MPTGTGPIAKPRRKRLARDRFQGLAQPKPLREIDRAAMATPRSPRCLHCGRPGPTHRHHLKTRGSGGSDRFTIDLCPFCHDATHKAQTGYRKADLLRSLETRRPTAPPLR